MTRSEIEESIKTVTQKTYDQKTPAEDQHAPRLIGTIPEVQNGMLMKYCNEQRFRLSLGIPQFERSIAELAEHLLPYYKGHATTRRPSNLLPKCLLDFEVMLVETGVDQLDIITNLVRIETGLPTYSCQCR